jgi:sugar lactone lactonase YvrE
MRRRARVVTALAGLLAAALVYGVYYGIRWPRQLHADWQVVDKIRLSRPDALALDADGRLRYVTLETIPGFLVELTAEGPRTVFGDFGEPDGLLLLDDGIVVTEDDPNGRVMLYNPATAKLRILARVDHPKGVLRLADGRILVAQDLPAGRVLEIGSDGQTKTVLEGLDRPKALCQLPDGRIGIAESGQGRILAHGPAGVEVLAEHLDNLRQLACGSDGSLWVVLSAVRSGRLVLIKDGRRRVIARHLREPQGIALAPDGCLHLAQTRANRVLHLKPR